MAEDNLKDFTINWILAGFLLTCLLAFAIGFMYQNNPTGLGSDVDSVFATAYSNSSGSLEEVQGDANSLLNITANTNPEIGQLGSRDSVSAGFLSGSTAKSKFTAAKTLIVWVFSGTTGALLLGIIGGIVTILTVFYIAKFIKGWN